MPVKHPPSRRSRPPRAGRVSRRAQANGQVSLYAYDANGNRTSRTQNGVTQAYAVDDGDKLVSVREGGTVVKSYAYDAAGRTTGVTTSAGTTTLAYDYESRVTGIAYPGGATNAFSYNGLDARVGKADSGGTKTFRRDGAGVTDDVLSDGAAAYTPGVSQRRSGATTYELQDRMGSSVRQTDASRSSTGARAYDAYGVQIGTDRTPVGPFGFAGAHGYQGDGDSGLKLLGHRYYDPSTGRFLTRDPIKDGRNWYAYCGGNPLEGHGSRRIEHCRLGLGITPWGSRADRKDNRYWYSDHNCHRRWRGDC